MRNLVIFIINFAIAYLRALSPGGAKALAMECASLRYQIAISNRGKKRAPNFKTIDRFIFGILPFFVKEKRIAKLAIILKPATILLLGLDKHTCIPFNLVIPEFTDFPRDYESIKDYLDNIDS